MAVVAGFGGGGFGGGGYHSYGGSGGSGSSGTAIFFIIVAIVILVVVIRAMQDMQRTNTVRRGTQAIDLNLAERLAKQLKQNDPNFDAAKFYARVADAFRKIQTAWSAHDLRPMQPFVSDGVFERFGLQIREQQSLGYRDRMDNVRVDRVLLAKVSQGRHFRNRHAPHRRLGDRLPGLADRRQIHPRVFIACSVYRILDLYPPPRHGHF